MKINNYFVKIAVPMLILTLWSSAAQAFNRPWSDWYQLKDEALNGIWFSWKCNDGRCEWRWDNRYKSEVKISYSFRLIDTDGAEKRNKGEQRLASGHLESVEFVLAAKELKGVEVEIIEPKYTGPKSSNYVPSSTREVDEEKRIREAEAIAEKERVQRQQEYEAQQQREDEEFDRQQRLAQKRADDAEFREQILDFGRTVSNAAVQGSQKIENARMQRYALERAQAEEKQRREREDNRRQVEEQRRHREEQDRQRKKTARQAQEADERRHHQEETARLQREQQTYVAQQNTVSSQRSELVCTDATPMVTATQTHHRDGLGHCDGYMTATLTNHSLSEVSCAYNFMRGNSLSPSMADQGQVRIKPGITAAMPYSGLWTCGKVSSDGFRFSCTSTLENSCEAKAGKAVTP